MVPALSHKLGNPTHQQVQAIWALSPEDALICCFSTKGTIINLKQPSSIPPSQFPKMWLFSLEGGRLQWQKTVWPNMQMSSSPCSQPGLKQGTAFITCSFSIFQFQQICLTEFQLDYKFELRARWTERAFQDCSSIITGFTLLNASSALLGKISPARNTPWCINTNRRAVSSKVSFNILTYILHGKIKTCCSTSKLKNAFSVFALCFQRFTSGLLRIWSITWRLESRQVDALWGVFLLLRSHKWWQARLPIHWTINAEICIYVFLFWPKLFSVIVLAFDCLLRMYIDQEG